MHKLLTLSSAVTLSFASGVFAQANNEIKIPESTESSNAESANAKVETLEATEMTGSAAVEPTLSGFTPGEQQSTSMLGASWLETPRSVSVINEEVYNDFKLLTLTDASRFVSGVERQGSNRGAGETFIIRGFAQQDTFQDGMRLGPASDILATASPVDSSRVESIEVIKGPASILYGRGEPGGMVNYITKQAEFESSYSFRQDFGSDDYIRSEVDLNTPLGETVAVRVSGAYNEIDGPVDNEEFEDISISPTLTWLISDQTEFKLRADIQQSEGTIATTFVPTGSNDTFFIGDPDYNDYDTEQYSVMASLEHEFTENFSTELALQYVEADIERLANNFRPSGPPFGPVLPFPDFVLPLFADIEADNERYSFRVMNEYLHEFENGIESTTHFGFDYEDEENDSYRTFGAAAPFDPTSGSADFDGAFIFSAEDQLRETEEISIVFLETLKIDRLTLQAGFRYSWIDSERQTQYPSGFVLGSEEPNNQEYDEFIPTAGVLYQLTDELSAYYNYAESFNPNFGAVAFGGGDLDPESGELHEVGIKYVLNDRLFFSAAIFDITKEDTVAADSDAPPGFSKNIGEESSTGFEFDVVGDLTEEISIIFNYARINAEIEDDGEDGSLNGNDRYGTPENSASLFGTYEFLDGALSGLTLGAGCTYRDEVYATNDNDQTFDSATLFDAFVAYKYKGFDLAFNVNNITDEDIIYASNRANEGTPGYGTQYIFSAKFTF